MVSTTVVLGCRLAVAFVTKRPETAILAAFRDLAIVLTSLYIFKKG